MIDKSRFLVIPGGKSLKPAPKKRPKPYLVCAGCLSVRMEQEPFRPCSCGRYGVQRLATAQAAMEWAERYKKYRAESRERRQQERLHG